jgi:hypothetical protein
MYWTFGRSCVAYLDWVLSEESSSRRLCGSRPFGLGSLQSLLNSIFHLLYRKKKVVFKTLVQKKLRTGLCSSQMWSTSPGGCSPMFRNSVLVSSSSVRLSNYFFFPHLDLWRWDQHVVFETSRTNHLVTRRHIPETSTAPLRKPKDFQDTDNWPTWWPGAV